MSKPFSLRSQGWQLLIVFFVRLQPISSVDGTALGWPLTLSQVAATRLERFMALFLSTPKINLDQAPARRITVL